SPPNRPNTEKPGLTYSAARAKSSCSCTSPYTQPWDGLPETTPSPAAIHPDSAAAGRALNAVTARAATKASHTARFIGTPPVIYARRRPVGRPASRGRARTRSSVLLEWILPPGPGTTHVLTSSTLY